MAAGVPLCRSGARACLQALEADVFKLFQPVLTGADEYGPCKAHERVIWEEGAFRQSDI